MAFTPLAVRPACRGAQTSPPPALHRQYRPERQRPGFIYTEMHADGGEPGRVDRVKSVLPMQRGGQPEEVAQAIVWLLSEKASYVTGSFIELAGGK